MQQIRFLILRSYS